MGKSQQTPSCPSIKPSPPSNRNGLHHKMGPQSKAVVVSGRFLHLIVKPQGGISSPARFSLLQGCRLHVLLFMETVHDFCSCIITLVYIGRLRCLSSPAYPPSMSPATGMLRCSAHVTSASQVNTRSQRELGLIGT